MTALSRRLDGAGVVDDRALVDAAGPGAAIGLEPGSDTAVATANAPDGLAPGTAGDRLRQLFRHTLRSGVVSPLIHIVRVHRAAPAPNPPAP